ncbi:G-protein coupled receptor 54-like [Antedon mediterranea]|uniref:G-protein coupled receptor 54-like n=1 Tax=Antedon mediterranea TaxID=105859 RepID=UPI003AF539C9
MDDNATFPAAGINDYDISYGNDYYDIVNMLDVEQIAIPFTWTLFIVVGLGCNSLIIYVVCRFGTMRTVTNCYIVNISVTDIMFLVLCAPFTIFTYTKHVWIFGNALCRIVMYLMQVSVHATSLTLMAMNIDRYFAIVYPLKSIRYRTPTLALTINISIWIISSLLSIPISIFSMVMDFNGRHYCVEEFNEQGLLAHYIYVVFSTYIIPLSVLVVCNVNMLRQLWKTREQLRDTTLSLHSIQQRKKVTKMILLVVVFFFICWLPIHVINLWQRLGNSINNNLAISKLRIFALTLAYSNSCVNPFVYAFMGENFRACFRRAFPMCTKVNRVRNSSMLLNNNRTRETQVQKDMV